MAVTIELKPEVEASLAALAAKRGLELSQLVERLLESQLPPAAAPLSAAERAAAWRAHRPDLPIRPPLSDEAVSRAGIYGAHG
jgi:hypothetical protein